MHIDPKKYPLKTKYINNQKHVFDPIRKKYVLLLPEELVRQSLINHLINDYGYSKSLISVEKALKVNERTKRYDIVVFNNECKPYILIECKSPNIKINIEAIEQVSWYNFVLKAEYLLITNGKRSLISKMDYEQEIYEYIDDLPTSQ